MEPVGACCVIVLAKNLHLHFLQMQRKELGVWRHGVYIIIIFNITIYYNYIPFSTAPPRHTVALFLQMQMQMQKRKCIPCYLNQVSDTEDYTGKYGKSLFGGKKAQMQSR